MRITCAGLGPLSPPPLCPTFHWIMHINIYTYTYIFCRNDGADGASGKWKETEKETEWALQCMMRTNITPHRFYWNINNNNSRILYSPIREPTEFQQDDISVYIFKTSFMLSIFSSILCPVSCAQTAETEALAWRMSSHERRATYTNAPSRLRQPTLSPFPCSSSLQQLQPMAAHLHFRCTTAVPLFIIKKYMNLCCRLLSLWSCQLSCLLAC